MEEKNRIMAIVLVSIFLLTIFTSQSTAVAIWSQTHVEAEITDMWLDGDRCVFEIKIISTNDNYTYFEPEDVIFNLTAHIGETYEVKCIFFDNESKEIRSGYGSNGYSIGDIIYGDLDFFMDEDRSSYSLYAPSTSDENYASSKFVRAEYIATYFIIAIIILLPIVWLLRKRKDRPK